jgi:hypothetical protein
MLARADLSISLKKIGGGAFGKCPSLREVIINSPNPPAIVRSTFKDVVACTFLVPKGCKSLFTANKDWQKINTIKEK